MSFRPALPGLVSVVVGALGFPPDTGGNGSGGGGQGSPPSGGPPGQAPPATQFHSFTVAVRLEILKPDRTQPVATAVRKTVVTSPEATNRLVVSALATATATDLAGDWTARVTNVAAPPVTALLGPARYDVTARYQVVPGNLGKIDHIVVLMMENRSFDHVLGYLSLPTEGGRKDVDGLTGAEFNRDVAGIAHPVVRRGSPGPGLPETAFLNDPGHGFTEVAEQLSGDAEHASNAGFVRNFAGRLQDDAALLPPLLKTVRDLSSIASHGTRSISFRPAQPGLLSVAATGTQPLSPFTSLGRVTVRRPGSTEVVASGTAAIGARTIEVSHVVTDAELATGGDWTCEVTNATVVENELATTITYVELEHDTRGQEQPAAVMSYYTAGQLNVYAALARRFSVCDRWFASLPTDTWPNRLYALTGGSGGLRNTPSGSTVAADPPGYDLISIFQVLADHGVDWGYFFSDLPFALVFKRLAQDATYTSRMRGIDELLRRAHTGDLPSVCWVDPNFSDIPDDVNAASDDHPPGDMSRGQKLVGDLYAALTSGPAWPKTLFIITYDEHGGFYDHVLPPGNGGAPGAPDDPDFPDLARYGVRVPTFLVSPWVKAASVAKRTYDHTSVLATILRRFCAGADGTVPSMGHRVSGAADLGQVLTAGTPRLDAPPPGTPSPPVTVPEPESDRGRFGTVLHTALFGF